MSGTSMSWLTIGISLAVIVLSLARIIGYAVVSRSLKREAERYQAEREERGQKFEIAKKRVAERIRADGEATIAAILKSGEETRERIRASGEATRRQIAETHRQHTGRTLDID